MKYAKVYTKEELQYAKWYTKEELQELKDQYEREQKDFWPEDWITIDELGCKLTEDEALDYGQEYIYYVHWRGHYIYNSIEKNLRELHEMFREIPKIRSSLQELVDVLHEIIEKYQIDTESGQHAGS